MILFIELMKLICRSTTAMLRFDFHSKLQNRFFEFVKANSIKVSSYVPIAQKDPKHTHTKIADKLRNSKFFTDLYEFQKFSVENKTLFQKPKWNPFFFQDILELTCKNGKKGSRDSSHNSLFKQNHSTIRNTIPLKLLYQQKFVSQRKLHLIILVHGYQGSRYDMRVYQNFLVKILPECIAFSSQANEDMDGKTIGDMGRDLAQEVSKLCQMYRNFSKISFIGHSLGGVIIRQALTHLKDIRPYCFSFLSLSSPHLGCRKNKSMLVSLGMKYLKKVRKDYVITQLQLDDHENIKETFMYELANKDCLHWFRNIILVSSPQDSYVPYLSARIQSPKPSTKSKSDQACFEMAHMIWKKVENEIIVRMDVDIRSQER